MTEKQTKIMNRMYNTCVREGNEGERIFFDWAFISAHDPENIANLTAEQLIGNPIVTDLIDERDYYEQAANEWMEKHDKLKCKYEPSIWVPQQKEYDPNEYTRPFYYVFYRPSCDDILVIENPEFELFEKVGCILLGEL